MDNKSSLPMPPKPKPPKKPEGLLLRTKSFTTKVSKNDSHNPPSSTDDLDVIDILRRKNDVSTQRNTSDWAELDKIMADLNNCCSRIYEEIEYTEIPEKSSSPRQGRRSNSVSHSSQPVPPPVPVRSSSMREKPRLQATLTKREAEFNQLKKNMLKIEHDFIAKLTSVSESKIYKHQKANYSKIKFESLYGLLEGLLAFHTKVFLHDIEKCDSILEIADLFIRHEHNLLLHIEDLWKKDNLKTDEDFGVGDFKRLPYEQLKQYLIELQLIRQCSNHKIDWNEFNKAYDSFKNIFTQATYVIDALKCIKESNVPIEDCGFVRYKQRFQADINTSSIKKKKVPLDVFFTEKFVILTEYKDSAYICYDCLPLNKTTFDVYDCERKMDISFGTVNKKVYSITIADVKSYQKICDALSEIDFLA